MDGLALADCWEFQTTFDNYLAVIMARTQPTKQLAHDFAFVELSFATSSIQKMQ